VGRIISGITKPTFVCNSPRLSSPLFYSLFRIHSTRDDGHQPLCIDQPRGILPNLTRIEFKGVSEYLEEILARIDSPRLNELTFFNQIIFDTPQLFQFVSQRPTLGALEKGYIKFNSEAVLVYFTTQTSASDWYELGIGIQCTALDWQLSSLDQVCTSSLPLVSTLKDLYLYIENSIPRLRWQDDVENTQWLELLHPFSVVKNLYLSEEIVLRIAPALQELVGGRTTEVLPILENMFFEGFQPSGALHEGIEKFVAARRLTGHPVAVSRWDRFNDTRNRRGTGRSMIYNYPSLSTLSVSLTFLVAIYTSSTIFLFLDITVTMIDIT